MERFSEAYEACRKALKDTGSFPAEWQSFLQETMKVTSLLGSDGPEQKHAGGLDELRKRILAAPVGKRGDLLAGAAATAKAKSGDGQRAASLKMLWHLYLANVRGGQSLWIYSPPVGYSKWVHDEISGEAVSFVSKLELTSEVYSEQERKIMSSALNQALRASQLAAAKLHEPDEQTTNIFRLWFADETTSDEQVKAAMSSIASGFQKIAGMCNNHHLVFSDEPIDRNGGGWKDYAFVDPSETLNVVYPQGAFLKAAASTDRVWICVETIVHEISHRVCGTDDFGYDQSGLKPSSKGITFNHAIRNADSWGYFCVDIAGMLARSTRDPILAKGRLLKAA